MVTAAGCSALVLGFRLALTVDRMRPHTVSCYVRDVERLGDFLTPRAITKATSGDIRAFLDHLGDGRSPKTVREAQPALRRFFRFLMQEGDISNDPTAPVRLVKFQVVPQPAYTEAEVKRLLADCSTKTLDGVRDCAALLVLYDTGVREGELVSMEVPNWNTGTVRVSGKTGVRDVPLGVATLQAVERYVRRWGIMEGMLWRGKRGALTESGVLQMVQRRCQAADVTYKGVHAFRRTTAAQMKRLGMNDSDILEVMGWKSIAMLRRYTANVAAELAHRAHSRHSPADSLR